VTAAAPNRLVTRTAAASAGRGDLDDTEYREAVEQVGNHGLFYLFKLVGYHAMLALRLRMFRVPAPGWQRTPSLPLTLAPPS
jgi:hypothetical protein